jgi:hypothetical protein
MEGQTLHSNTHNRFEYLTQQRSTIELIDVTLENDDRRTVKEMVRTPSIVSSALIRPTMPTFTYEAVGPPVHYLQT